MPNEDGAEETGQEIMSPDAYIKHPLQNRLVSGADWEKQMNMTRKKK